jgi:hypothetical protein
MVMDSEAIDDLLFLVVAGVVVPGEHFGDAKGSTQ